MERFTSRKFLLAVVAGLILIANQGLGLNIPEDTILAFAGLVIAYIFGQGAVDAVAALKK